MHQPSKQECVRIFKRKFHVWWQLVLNASLRVRNIRSYAFEEEEPNKPEPIKLRFRTSHLTETP